jgi:hypothetical protein
MSVSKVLFLFIAVLTLINMCRRLNHLGEVAIDEVTVCVLSMIGAYIS